MHEWTHLTIFCCRRQTIHLSIPSVHLPAASYSFHLQPRDYLFFFSFLLLDSWNSQSVFSQSNQYFSIHDKSRMQSVVVHLPCCSPRHGMTSFTLRLSVSQSLSRYIYGTSLTPVNSEAEAAGEEEHEPWVSCTRIVHHFQAEGVYERAPHAHPTACCTDWLAGEENKRMKRNVHESW